jgi:hypothetical protein
VATQAGVAGIEPLVLDDEVRRASHVCLQDRDRG